MARDEAHPAKTNDLECSLLVLSGMVGRVIAEHPGAKIAEIDCYEHTDVPDRVVITVELTSGHLHGATIPLMNSHRRLRQSLTVA